MQEHKPSKARRLKVCLCVSQDLTEREIAVLMNISRETLHKYYGLELLDGKAIISGQVRDMLWHAARCGSVTAMKYLDMRLRGEKVGVQTVSKKDKQAKAARDAMLSSEWSHCLADIDPPRD